MVNRIIDCTVINCGGDGYHIGDGVQVEMSGNKSINNKGNGFYIGKNSSSLLRGNVAENNGGDGFRLAGKIPNEITDNRASGNSGHGFNFVEERRKIVDQLDLPKGIDRDSIDPAELGCLLAVLGITAPERKPDVVKNSSLLAKIKGTFDTTSFISSLVTISADPRVQSLINKLMD